MYRHLVLLIVAVSFVSAINPQPSPVDDLVAAEDRSREELEISPDTAVANPDDSASQEEPKKPSTNDEDDDDEDDDDDDDAVSAVFQSFPNIFKILRMPSNRPWWDGPNVCVERDVKESSKENDTETSSSNNNNFFIFGTAQFSSCKHSPNKYQCTTITSENGKTKTSTVTYQCCHGFRRSPKNPGCSKIDTKPLVELAEESGCGQFAQALRAAAGEELSQGNVTIFAVTDEAMASTSEGEGMKISLMTNEVNDEKAADSGNNQVVLNHIVSGLIETDDFYNDLVLHSRLDNGTLRVNVFPGRKGTTMTVNCAKLNSTDKISTEGVLHTVSSVLRPVTHSVKELLSQPKYSQFKQLLEENDLMDKLDGSGPVTVLAMTNDHLEKAEVPKMCLKRVLEHHILPHTVCSEAASQGKVAALDLSSDWVRLEKDENGILHFDGNVKAITPDVVATNGVVHEVDSFAVPQAAKTGTELLKATNHTKFLALIERAGLTKTLDEAQDVTIFVPSESGITEHEDELMEMDDAKLRELLLYHIVPKPVPSNRLRNNDALDTMSEGQSLPISLVSNMLAGLAGLGTRALVGCAPITRVDGDVCNGVVHEIAAPVMPPTKTLFTVLQGDENLKEFRKILEGTKLEEELKAGSLKDVTLLAPTDEAFSALGSDNMDILLKDKDLADQILRNHVLKGRVCCGSVGVSAWPFVSSEASLGGMPVETNRIRSRVTFSGVVASQCDAPATDGLMHHLSGVIFPAGLRRDTDIIYRRPTSDIILTGF